MARLVMKYNSERKQWPRYWLRFMRGTTDLAARILLEEPLWMATASHSQAYMEAKRRMYEEHRVTMTDLGSLDQAVLGFETEADLSRFLLTWS